MHYALPQRNPWRTALVVTVVAAGLVGLGAGPAQAEPVKPVPAEYAAAVKTAGTTCSQIDSALVASIVNNESAWDANARSVTDRVGPGQLGKVEQEKYLRAGESATSPVDGTIALSRYLCDVAQQVDERLGGKAEAAQVQRPAVYVAAFWAGVNRTVELVTKVRAEDSTDRDQTAVYVQRVMSDGAEYAGQGI